MNKWGKLLPAVLLACSLSVTAAAAAETEPEEAATGDSMDFVGMDVVYPEVFDNLKGVILPQAIGAIGSEHHHYGMLFYYIAMPEEEAEKGLNGESEESIQEVRKHLYPAGLALATSEDLDACRKAFEDSFGEEKGTDWDHAVELGTAGAYTFYAVTANIEEAVAGMDQEFAEEFREVEDGILEMFKGAKLYEPVDYDKDMIGQKIEFTTTDLDGNTVTSEELFSQNEITMVNCWGLWCPNCVGEMSELAELNTKLQEKGCGIVGLEWERTSDAAAYADSKKALEEYGTNYPSVIMTEEIVDKVGGFPTTYFVDKEGTVLCMPICGAYVDQYEPTLDALLAGDHAKANEAAAQEADTSVQTGFDICVKDADGPVAGVMVQMCDNVTCNFGVTDEEGKAHFDLPAGAAYDVHVVSAPDGYAADENVYHPEAGSSEIEIELQKAS